MGNTFGACADRKAIEAAEKVKQIAEQRERERAEQLREEVRKAEQRVAEQKANK